MLFPFIFVVHFLWYQSKTSDFFLANTAITGAVIDSPGISKNALDSPLSTHKPISHVIHDSHALQINLHKLNELNYLK